jgi:hypothetical protein
LFYNNVELAGAADDSAAVGHREVAGVDERVAGGAKHLRDKVGEEVHSLLALEKEGMMKWLIDSMTNHKFYLKVPPHPMQHRYVLENLLNGKVTTTAKNALTFATSKFDEQFVKGPPSDGEELKKSLNKQRRLNFAIEKEEIVGRLHALAQQIFLIEGEEEKRICFEERITEINSVLTQKEEESSDSEGEGEEGRMRGLYVCAGNTLRKITEIDLKRSYYIKTKNRHPMVLDFKFARYSTSHAGTSTRTTTSSPTRSSPWNSCATSMRFSARTMSSPTRSCPRRWAPSTSSWRAAGRSTR